MTMDVEFVAEMASLANDGVRCSFTGCKACFSIAGCGVSMGVLHKDIESWPAIIEPARALIISFIKQ